MTPLQFAQAWCANWQPGGSCLGVNIHDDLTQRIGTPKPKCVCGDARCEYFEQCVAPVAKRLELPRPAVEAKEAIYAYKQRTGALLAYPKRKHSGKGGQTTEFYPPAMPRAVRCVTSGESGGPVRYFDTENAKNAPTFIHK